MRKLPATAAEDLLELVMRRYERVSTLLTSNRPVDDWGKLLGDTATVTALLDRLLHHAHGPKSCRPTAGASAAASTKRPAMLARTPGGPLQALVGQPLLHRHPLGDEHLEKGLVRHVALVRERF